ncbi:MAG: nucleotidyltransferase domain-containing protein [bacterium]
MWETSPSAAVNKSLEAIFKTLKNNSNINAILLFGSTAKSEDKEYSDYDIACIVNKLPKSLLSINTWINKRFAEIFFYSKDEVENLLKQEKIDTDKKEGWLVKWSRGGKIIVDKSRLLEKVKSKSQVKTADFVTDSLVYSSWHKINYNYVQNKRYFNSKNEDYLQVLDIRLFYSIIEVFVGYFNLKKIAWQGEKNAIKYLKDRDNNFLEIFQKCVNVTNREKKFVLYEQLVKLVLGSDIWEKGSTTTILTEFNEKTIKLGLSFWDSLLS